MRLIVDQAMAKKRNLWYNLGIHDNTSEVLCLEYVRTAIGHTTLLIVDAVFFVLVIVTINIAKQAQLNTDVFNTLN